MRSLVLIEKKEKNVRAPRQKEKDTETKDTKKKRRKKRREMFTFEIHGTKSRVESSPDKRYAWNTY